MILSAYNLLSLSPERSSCGVGARQREEEARVEGACPHLVVQCCSSKHVDTKGIGGRIGSNWQPAYSRALCLLAAIAAFSAKPPIALSLDSAIRPCASN